MFLQCKGMQKSKVFRDLVVLNRYIAEREADLRRRETAILPASGTVAATTEETLDLIAIRRALCALRARRDALNRVRRLQYST